MNDNLNANGNKLIAAVRVVLSNVYYVISVLVAVISIIVGQVTWQLHQEARMAETRHDLEALAQKLEAVDKRGTEAMVARLSAINDRLNTVAITEASKDNEFTGHIADLRKLIDTMDGKVDGVSAMRPRLDELDHRLSTLQENTRELAKLLLEPRHREEPRPRD